MSEKETILSEIMALVEKSGLSGITPVELNDAGNLSVHLSPYPVVARISTVMSRENPDLAYRILGRELLVAYHLKSRDVPVLLPSGLVDPGPYNTGGTWTSFWEYITPVDMDRPSPGEAYDLVTRMSAAMKEYPGELPVLGAWERTCLSVGRLKNNTDKRVQALLKIFVKVNEQMRLAPDSLAPCHGDANIGNLFPGPEGFVWMDFEDVSLMLPYWDMASYACIPALFRGVKIPLFQYILAHLESRTELEAFELAITARTLTSTLGNLDYALAGNGDLDFAEQELEIAEDFICQVQKETARWR
ncbi:MAG: hypothetical protein JW712_07170 [Dehalococcoidales bacterium]|nr:hypothetical protein [Dehalococcoidales bacterium]